MPSWRSVVSSVASSPPRKTLARSIPACRRRTFARNCWPDPQSTGPLSLHDAFPICSGCLHGDPWFLPSPVPRRARRWRGRFPPVGGGRLRAIAGQIRRAPVLFPYTTLFRSVADAFMEIRGFFRRQFPAAQDAGEVDSRLSAEDVCAQLLARSAEHRSSFPTRRFSDL